MLAQRLGTLIHHLGSLFLGACLGGSAVLLIHGLTPKSVAAIAVAALLGVTFTIAGTQLQKTVRELEAALVAALKKKDAVVEQFMQEAKNEGNRGAVVRQAATSSIPLVRYRIANSGLSNYN